MKVFSLGFVFSPGQEQVLLLKKRSTDPYTADAWNGVGGHVEPGETPVVAVNREVYEEAGLALHSTHWSPLGEISDGKTFQVHVFAAIGDLDSARQKTDEVISVFDRTQAQALTLAAGLDSILAPWLAGDRLVKPSCPRAPSKS